MTHIQICGYFMHCYTAIFLHDGFNCCNGLWCHYSVCLTWSRRPIQNYRRSVTSYSIHTLAVETDMHHCTELPFVDEFRWVSPIHFVKNEWQTAVRLWCMLQVGPPYLHHHCTIVLHFSIVLPPVSHSSNHEYHCCQLTGQSSDVSNFYHSFKVFIWLKFANHNSYCYIWCWQDILLSRMTHITLWSSLLLLRTTWGKEMKRS